MACTAKTHENEHLSYTQKETNIDTGMKPRQTATGITTTETKKEGKQKKRREMEPPNVSAGSEILNAHEEKRKNKPVEVDLLGLDLTVLDVDLVSNKDDGNVLADTDEILVPLGHILVGDAGAHIEHDNGAISANAISFCG
jgi:hypothetical protein